MKKYLNDKENIYTYISSLKNIEEKWYNNKRIGRLIWIK
jgi:hypothetical protein